MTKLYYTAPSDEAFDDMKAAATEIWHGYEDPYRSEKLDRIANIENVQDNFMYMFAMFDLENQGKVVSKLSPETKTALIERMWDGGNDMSYIHSLGL